MIQLILKHIKKFYILSAVMLLVSITFRVYSANCLVVDNKKLIELYAKKDSIEREMLRLSYKNAELSSLSTIEKKASELGFIPLTSSLLSVDIKTPVSIASLPNN
ncbi:hypothetical protein A3K42_01760 [candidate division WWE3 bacterium RBG_13_37_7]|uniref:Cell division protein FtsL n=1 Tax=candidate division WWE3 bacterium RBG_13_37_7 TaxID=1802609 RepID=A0A1F4U188_UNCKA|nr:MAG: hypothetical protein A3K42_01760 [candidate division WWE3 bacterium RBG_13_37_7]